LKSKRVKSIVLAIFVLHLNEGISQVVSRSVENFKKSMETFENVLSPFQGSCLAGFWTIIFLWAAPTFLWSLLFTTIVLRERDIVVIDKDFQSKHGVCLDVHMPLLSSKIGIRQ